MATKKQSISLKRKDNKKGLITILSLLAFICFLLRFNAIVQVLPIPEPWKPVIIDWATILMKVFVGLIVLLVGYFTLPIWTVVGIILLLLGAGMVVVGSIDIWNKDKKEGRLIDD